MPLQASSEITLKERLKHIRQWSDHTSNLTMS